MSKILSYDINKFNYFYSAFSQIVGEDHIKASTFSFDSKLSDLSCIKTPDKNRLDLNKKYPFRFFEPDFYLCNNKWELVSNNCYDFFDLSSELTNLVKIKFISKSSKSFLFNPRVSWTQPIFFVKSFEIDIENVDLDLFKINLNKYKDTPSFSILNFEFKDIQHEWFLQNNCLFKKDSCKLHISILFFHDSVNEESLKFLFSMQHNTTQLNDEADYSIQSHSVIRQKVNRIKIRDNSSISYWDCDRKYVYQDVVFFDNTFFKCLVEKSSNEPKDNADWEKITPISFSDSFCKSSEGSRCLSLFNENFHSFVNKIIGDEVILYYYSQNIPKLNSIFEYKAKKYKVVETKVSIKNGNSFIILKGIYCLNLPQISFENLFQSIDEKNVNISDNLIYDVCKDQGSKFLIVISPSKSIKKFEYQFNFNKESGLYV